MTTHQDVPQPDSAEAFGPSLSKILPLLHEALAKEGRFGRMVSYQAYHVDSVPIEDAVHQLRLVDPEGEMVNAAKAVGISFGA